MKAKKIMAVLVIAIMMIGIAGMFLAPFGMLISKWAALKAFVDINNVYFYLTILNICLAFHVAHFFTIEKLRRGYILFAVLALVNLSGWIGFEVIRYLI